MKYICIFAIALSLMSFFMLAWTGDIYNATMMGFVAVISTFILLVDLKNSR
jgi:asparagine N-glycosylation enzyme membrane subunit Stt3